MIETGVYLLGADAFTVEIKVEAADSSGNGIRNILLRDRGGRLINDFIATGVDGQPCPDRFTFTTRVVHNRFPIVVEAIDCEDESFVGEPIPLLGPSEEAEAGLEIALPCDPLFCRTVVSRDCEDAMQTLERLRHEINALCSELASLRERRDYILGLAIALGIAAAVLAVLAAVVSAIPFAQGAATGLWALAAVFLAVALAGSIVAGALAREINIKMAELGGKQREFGGAVGEAMSNCCLQCLFVDLTPPVCD